MKLAERDRAHIWHPLTQHQTAKSPIAIVKAEGALLWDENGNEYIDAIASWYTAMYGHCNEHIVAAVSEQMQNLDQIVFTGFTHKPAIILSEKLMEVLPENQHKIFFNDNGSTAVEAAIKMAFQFFYNKGIKKNTLLSFEDGFHGDTFGAMSASGVAVYNEAFKDHFLHVKRIVTPKEDNINELLESLDEILTTNDVAAFIYEPLVQGAAGMKFHDAHLLDLVLSKCKENNVLCIADEVMTGFGKTGRVFASDYMQTKPDIICLSKSLTAGLIPMSITSCSKEVYDAFLDDSIAKGFMHAHTYSANPLACSAAIVGLKLLRSAETTEAITVIEHSHSEFINRIQHHPSVKNARTLGVIMAIDLHAQSNHYGKLQNKLYDFFMAKGVFLRPLGSTIYVLPPYVISTKQLQKVYDCIEEALSIF